MKNTEIHNGLDKKEIRDFLSMSLVTLFEEECDYIKEKVHDTRGLSQVEWAIKNCENEIKYHVETLKLLKRKDAIVKLIENNGWREFDVSDHTINDTQKRLCMNFVGTEIEYEEFINNLTK